MQRAGLVQVTGLMNDNRCCVSHVKVTAACVECSVRDRHYGVGVSIEPMSEIHSDELVTAWSPCTTG